VQILSLARASFSLQVKQKGQISLNSHEATSARYYTDRGNFKYSMQIPERVTFEFGHPTCVGTLRRTMHGRAINGICPRQLVGDIIEEIPLHEHLVKYVKGMYRNCRRMPTTNLSSIILPSHQFLSRSVKKTKQSYVTEAARRNFTLN